jgi:hypothetical protein
MADAGVIYAILFLVSAILLGLVMFVLWLRLGLETRLIVLGIVVGVAAVWYGALTGSVTSQGPNRPNVAIQFTGDLAHGFMKLAAFLVLGGIAAALLGPARVTDTSPEGARNVPPI